MPPRSSWKGFLRLSLVSVPVKAYTATASGGEIRLNQLHKECHSPIKYKKTCPLHGEVAGDEIVSGYQYSKGQYVEIDPEELGKLRGSSEKSIEIDGFVPSAKLDPIHFRGKNYYLVPDGPVGQKPYALLRRGMAEKNLSAIAQVVLTGKEQLVTVRPLDRILVMTVLNFESQIKKPESFQDEIVSTEFTDEEIQLAETLIQASALEEFDHSKYRDTYTENLTRLIEAKVEGEEIVTAPVSEEPEVINLMDALKKSVQEALQKGGKEVAAAGKRKMAPSTRKKATRKRKKKTS